MWLMWIYIVFVVNLIQGQRYRFCSEGCCPEEFCAFHIICYPKTHCFYGCPDGTCEKHVCMPHTPCEGNADCALGNVCTINYNLGYDTCQYNLEIGKTLCVDKDGNSLIVPKT